MEGISLQELKVGLISILLYEVGRLLVDWWYPFDFQADVEFAELDPRPGQLQPQPKKLGPGLVHTYWWYTDKGRKDIDRAFFGSVVEFWVHKTFRRFTCHSTHGEEFRFKLGGVQGLGFHRYKADTVLGASSLFGWSVFVTCHLISSFSTFRYANGRSNI